MFIGMLFGSDGIFKIAFDYYKEESNMTLMRMYVPANHPWVGQEIKNVVMPTGSLALMIKRAPDTIIPRGDTILFAGDDIILSVPSYESESTKKLEEIHIEAKHQINYSK